MVQCKSCGEPATARVSMVLAGYQTISAPACDVHARQLAGVLDPRVEFSMVGV